jgi:hypothetical protein
MSSYAGNWKVILTQSDTFPLDSTFEISLVGSGNFLIDFAASECTPEQNPVLATVDGGNLASLAFGVSCVGGMSFKVRMLPPVGGRLNGIVQVVPLTALGAQPKSYEEGTGDPVGTWTAEEQGGQVDD